MDVVVIGGGNSGLSIAELASQSGLEVAVVEQLPDNGDACNGLCLRGRGVVSGPGLVAILDPETGDERRILQTRAIVIAAGRSLSVPAFRMLGVSKLGTVINPDSQIVVNSKGMTGAPGVFACGACAHGPTPDLMTALIEFCAAPLTGKNI